jgi:two-component system alkaline phosphatase synthesis response regulator PhoP
MLSDKILIIDDDRALVLILTQNMREAGYEIISAFDGVQGLRMAFQENPSLIVLDIRFPAGGGVETLKKLRSSSKTTNTPVLIVTAYDEPQIRQILLRYDIAGFFVKPIDPKSLISEINKIIGKNFHLT